MSTHEPNRRETLLGLAALGLAGCMPASKAEDDDTDGVDTDAPCPVRTGRQTEGPYYPGEPAVRMDITGGRPGVPLTLDLTLQAQGSCDPLEGAEVDVWCADADGDYSGYADFGTEGEDWLRGQQLSDADGVARFTAIVPGAYPGRAVHLHVKVRAAGRAELTTQVYLQDAVVADVLETAAYANSAAQVLNDDDNFYRSDTLMDVSGDVDGGFTASITLTV